LSVNFDSTILFATAVLKSLCCLQALRYP